MGRAPIRKSKLVLLLVGCVDVPDMAGRRCQIWTQHDFAMKLNNFTIRRLLAVFVSVALIVLVFWLSGVDNVLRRLAGFPLWTLTGVLALLAANLFLVSFRYWSVLAHFGIAIPWNVASRAYKTNHKTGLVVISLFGQVMGRQTV